MGDACFGVYACIVYRDAAFGRRPVVDEFTTELDPSDPRRLQAALAAAIRRDRSASADPAPYSMDVLDAAGNVIVGNYRPTEWLDEQDS